MRKSVMAMKCNMFIFCLTTGMFLVSCFGNGSNRSDGENNCLNLVELPASFLGTYTGKLETQQVTNPIGTATIMESGCRVYTINFSDNTPAITDIVFSSLNNEYVFGDSDRELGVRIKSEGVLFVSQVGMGSFIEGRK